LNRFFSMTGENLNKYKIGIGLLLTTRGIPQIYYGTEVLMKNFKDPNDAAVRWDFPGGWVSDATNKFSGSGRTDKENNAFEFFKILANYRKGSSASSSGDLKQYIPKNGVYVYFRISNNQKILCVVNTSSKEEQLNVKDYEEILHGNDRYYDVIKQSTFETKDNIIPLPAMSFQIFEIK